MRDSRHRCFASPPRGQMYNHHRKAEAEISAWVTANNEIALRAKFTAHTKREDHRRYNDDWLSGSRLLETHALNISLIRDDSIGYNWWLKRLCNTMHYANPRIFYRWPRESEPVWVYIFYRGLGSFFFARTEGERERGLCMTVRRGPSLSSNARLFRAWQSRLHFHAAGT